jgi:predicted enzyme related to lactoylglutathione lyase
MSAFYEHCLGFDPVDGGDRYRVLAAEGWTLSLVRAAQEIATGTSAPGHRRTEVPIKLGFGVPSIQEVRQTAEALGGQIDAPETAWDFRAFRHCDGTDPEGNVIQLLEPLGAQA